MRIKPSQFLLVLLAGCTLASSAQAEFIGSYALGNFSLFNSNADGSVATPDGGVTAVLTGGNNGSGRAGTTDIVIQAASAGVVTFDYSYSACNPAFPESCDLPGFDPAGFLLGGVFTQVADTDGQTGTGIQFTVTAGQLFGFRVATADNLAEAGILTITNFNAPTASELATPEPATLSLLVPVSGLFMFLARRRRLAPE